MVILGNFMAHFPPPPNKKQNINTSRFCIFVLGVGVSGCLESTGGNHTSRMGRVSNYLVTGNVGKPTISFPRFVALLTRLRFFFFAARNPDSIKNEKAMRAEQWSRLIFPNSVPNTLGATACHLVTERVPAFCLYMNQLIRLFVLSHQYGSF